MENGLWKIYVVFARALWLWPSAFGVVVAGRLASCCAKCRVRTERCFRPGQHSRQRRAVRQSGSQAARVATVQSGRVAKTRCASATLPHAHTQRIVVAWLFRLAFSYFQLRRGKPAARLVQKRAHKPQSQAPDPVPSPHFPAPQCSPLLELLLLLFTIS